MPQIFTLLVQFVVIMTVFRRRAQYAVFKYSLNDHCSSSYRPANVLACQHIQLWLAKNDEWRHKNGVGEQVVVGVGLWHDHGLSGSLWNVGLSRLYASCRGPRSLSVIYTFNTGFPRCLPSQLHFNNLYYITVNNSDNTFFTGNISTSELIQHFNWLLSE